MAVLGLDPRINPAMSSRAAASRVKPANDNYDEARKQVVMAGLDPAISM
jgi:hypothetical protein